MQASFKKGNLNRHIASILDGKKYFKCLLNCSDLEHKFWICVNLTWSVVIFWVNLWQFIRVICHFLQRHSMNLAFLKMTVGICEKAVIARENQTYFWENLQFSLITEGFQSHYSFGKTFSFSSKTEGNTNLSARLKQKVFQWKPSVFFYKKLKEN